MNLFAIDDLKVFLPGAGVALAAGLLLGGAMQPHLDTDDSRPAGPQMLAERSGARSEGPTDSGVALVAYRGNAPDYVLGTDWKKSMTWPVERASITPRESVRDDPTSEAPALLSRAAYDEPSPAPHAYPSLVGGAPSARSATDPGVTVEDDTVRTESLRG